MQTRIKTSYKYPFLYLLIPLVAGILSSRHCLLPGWSFAIFLLAAWCLKRYSKAVADLCLLAVFFCFGNSISQDTPPEYNPATSFLIESRCEEELPGNHYILSAYGERFYLSGFYTDTQYRAGDSLRFYARILPFRHNANPQEFSYAEYMGQRRVYHQLRPTSPICQEGHSHSLLSFFNSQRARLLDKTAALTKDSTCMMLVNALCLGYKNELQPELRNLFITTGTVHLLSVSGLHVGIIYLLILYLFKLFRPAGKGMLLLTLPLLWGYACLTGLSPSVVRAAMLLSFITIGKVFCQAYNPVNLLAASASLTLLVEPTALYSLSFLLSYSAYSGIMLLYPHLYHLPGKLPKFPARIYACFCVTIAAQLPTLPISAYYFHTINVNGFLANLIAVPLATILLYCSAICLVLPLAIGGLLMPVTECLCRMLTDCLEWFAPYMVNIRDIYPSGSIVIVLYAIFAATGVYLLHRKRFVFIGAICLTGLLLPLATGLNYHFARQEKVVIFHYYKQSAILLNHHGFYLPLKASTSGKPENMRPYILYHKLQALPKAEGVLGENISWLPPCLYFHSDTILIPDKQLEAGQRGNILIVTGDLSPHQVFGTAPSMPYPKEIILDGSNSFRTHRKWDDFCKRKGILFRNTAEEGAVYLHRK